MFGVINCRLHLRCPIEQKENEVVRLGRPAKIFLGLVTGAYLTLPVWFVLFQIVDILLESGDAQLSLRAINGLFIISLVCIFILLNHSLVAFYLVHIIKNKSQTNNFRIISGLGVFFLPVIAMPLYYYKCILYE